MTNNHLDENWDLRKATLGVLMKNNDELVILQKDEQIYNFCVTFLAWKLQLNAYELDKALKIVEVKLKDIPEKEGTKDEDKNTKKEE